MTRRFMSAALGALLLGWGGLAQAGQLYDSFGVQSPKIIQPDDSVVSEWDLSAAGELKGEARINSGQADQLTSDRAFTIKVRAPLP